MTENVKSTKNWTCKRISLQGNERWYGVSFFAFGLFVFFAVFLLAASYLSVIGIENIDLTDRLTLYWNPITDPFVIVLIVIFAISLITWIIAAGTRSICAKKK
jgi:polyferredoxin